MVSHPSIFRSTAFVLLFSSVFLVGKSSLFVMGFWMHVKKNALMFHNVQLHYVRRDQSNIQMLTAVACISTFNQNGVRLMTFLSSLVASSPCSQSHREHGLKLNTSKRLYVTVFVRVIFPLRTCILRSTNVCSCTLKILKKEQEHLRFSRR